MHVEDRHKCCKTLTYTHKIKMTTKRPIGILYRIGIVYIPMVGFFFLVVLFDRFFLRVSCSPASKRLIHIK